MTALRKQYQRYGVQRYYREHGASYGNPHEFAVNALIHQMVKTWPVATDKVLDLACGSGEVTLALFEVGCKNVSGIDPYTYAAYQKRTQQAAQRLSFEAIAAGKLLDQKYSLIICSFALHLLAESKLPTVLFQLALVAPTLIVITPHKKPLITAQTGWCLEDEMEIARVKAKLYRSQHFID